MSDPFSRLKSALSDRYTIESELGQGGMAIVYLAQDLKHDRKVAVKVLRPELAAVLGAARFLKEIAVTANLQHPHILPLFNSGEADGLPYYVSPYIRGESLQDKLDRETQLPLEESVAIAVAVGSALDYAHRQGLIHRDIKPANILLQDGQPIVADFGIALAVTAAGGRRLTETGLSIGTPEYMSPEQAIGGGVLDGRSDEYALACVLYEMLAGEPPHTGPNAQAVIAKVVTEEPRRITAARETVPPHVEFAVHRALAKLPADRFATVAGFAEALTSPGTRSRWLGAIPVLVRARVKRWGARVAVASLAVIALWGWLRPRPAPPSQTVVRFDVAHPGGASFGMLRHSIGISPDGASVAYAGRGDGGRQQLYLRRIDQLDARAIPGSDGAMDPFFSPDRQWVGFTTVAGLMKVPVSGGAPTRILEFAEPRGASWGPGGPDGDILFGSYTGLWRVSANGGSPTQITALDSTRGDRMHTRPEWLPGGQAVLFTITPDDFEQTQVALLDLRSGAITTLFPGYSPRYAPTGHIVYGRGDGVLMGVPFDAERFAVTGPSVELVNDVTVKPSATMEFALGDDGTLAYLTGDPVRGALVLVDRSGRDTAIIEEENVFGAPKFSPDGERITVGIGVPPTRQIWVYEMASGSLTPVTFSGNNYYPVWSPDGARIAYTHETANSADLRWTSSDGTEVPRLLLGNTGNFNYPESWHGNHLVFRRQESATQRDLWVLPMDGDSTPRRLFETPVTEDAPVISPDGRWLAFASNQSEQYEIYVTSFPNPGRPILVSRDGGTEPVWARNSSELFYRRGSELIAATFEDRPTFRVRGREVLFDGPYNEWPFHSNFDVHPDGERFVMVAWLRTGSGRIIVSVNWLAELQRLMRDGG